MSFKVGLYHPHTLHKELYHVCPSMTTHAKEIQHIPVLHKTHDVADEHCVLRLMLYETQLTCIYLQWKTIVSLSKFIRRYKVCIYLLDDVVFQTTLHVPPHVSGRSLSQNIYISDSLPCDSSYQIHIREDETNLSSW